MGRTKFSRQHGVTYKPAYRIDQQTRNLMHKAQGFAALLSGRIEVDEAYIGDRLREKGPNPETKP